MCLYKRSKPLLADVTLNGGFCYWQTCPILTDKSTEGIDLQSTEAVILQVPSPSVAGQRIGLPPNMPALLLAAETYLELLLHIIPSYSSLLTQLSPLNIISFLGDSLVLAHKAPLPVLMVFTA